jgi:hypothetical protein
MRDPSRGAADLLALAVRDSRGLSAKALEYVASAYVGVPEPAADFEREVGKAMRSKRKKVEIPDILLREVEDLARGQDITASELVRRFVNLGVHLSRALDSSGASIIVREGEQERELIWL